MKDTQPEKEVAPQGKGMDNAAHGMEALNQGDGKP